MAGAVHLPLCPGRIVPSSAQTETCGSFKSSWTCNFVAAFLQDIYRMALELLYCFLSWLIKTDQSLGFGQWQKSSCCRPPVTSRFWSEDWSPRLIWDRYPKPKWLCNHDLRELLKCKSMGYKSASGCSATRRRDLDKSQDPHSCLHVELCILYTVTQKHKQTYDTSSI